MIKKNVIYLFLLFVSPLVCSENLIDDKNNTSVSVAEINVFLSHGPKSAQKKVLEHPNKTKKIVWDLYKLKALSRKAQDIGLGKSAEVQFKLNKLIDEFYAKLLLDEYVARQLPNIEGLAKREYQVNKEKYYFDEMVDISHIQIKTECRNSEEAYKLASEIKLDLENGADFDEMVALKSEDKGKYKNKGYLGRFKKGDMVDVFEEASFAMNDLGQLSQVLKYKDSYFILRLNQKIPKRQKSYSEAEEEILIALRKKILEAKKNDFIIELVEENEAQLDQQKLEEFVQNKEKEFVVE